MYIPEHFAITDEDEIFSFLETHSFGQIISKVNQRIFATHLPFLINREENMQSARNFVDSEEYAPVKKIRHANAECTLFIVDGA